MAKPIVDGLEERIGTQVQFARVDIFGEQGQQLAGRYGVVATPTYLLLDGGGNVVYRQVGGAPDTRAIEERLAALQQGHGPR